MSFKVAERSDGRLFSVISKCHCIGLWKRRACSYQFITDSFFLLSSLLETLPPLTVGQRRGGTRRTLTMDSPASTSFCNANLWSHLQIGLTRAVSFAFIWRCVVNRACCSLQKHAARTCRSLAFMSLSRSHRLYVKDDEILRQNQACYMIR